MITRSASIGREVRKAVFSECEKYRYSLEIVWDSESPLLVVIGLNPSKADHLQDDNTLHRVKGFARAFHCGGVRMLNAFAFRSTESTRLFDIKDPVGPENTLEFLRSNRTALTIAAWGSTIQKKPWKHYYRGHDIAVALPGLMCLRKTTKGHPEHPLYLPSELTPIAFSYGETA